MKSTTEIKKTITSICSTIEKMLLLSDMLRGSFGTIFRRCGKPNCWCADPQQEGHPCTRITWVDATGPKTRSIPDEDQQWIVNAIEKYRLFKKMKRQLRQQEKYLEELLTEYENESTFITRQKRQYLQG